MFSIISPENFTKVPWKNGAGYTLELAVSQGGSLSEFDWRLSIATVSQDGVFSDFSGLTRQLVLISGQGLALTHDESTIDSLNELMDFAYFDGGCKTTAQLNNGSIDDFNIMVRTGKFRADVVTLKAPSDITRYIETRGFIYSPSHDVTLNVDNQVVNIPAGHLACIDNSDKQALQRVQVTGQQAIIVNISAC